MPIDFGYISFRENFVRSESLANLPRGITLDNSDPCHVAIRWDLKAADHFELHINILNAAISLLNWVRSLPNNIE